MVECYQQTREDEEVRRRLRDVYASWLADITTLFRGLQAGGWVDPDQDAKLLAARVFAFVEGLSVHKTLYDLDGIDVADAVFAGLLGLLPRAVPR